jgi:hypothetical protein
MSQEKRHWQGLPRAGSAGVMRVGSGAGADEGPQATKMALDRAIEILEEALAYPERKLSLTEERIQAALVVLRTLQ